MRTVLLILLLTVKYSHYWPAAGGVSCARYRDGECVSRTASGDRWQDWVDRGCACPPEWPIGTTVELDGHVWTCVDRGGGIRFDDEGLTYVDFLTAHAEYGHGQQIEAEISRPVTITSGLEAYLLDVELGR